MYKLEAANKTRSDPSLCQCRPKGLKNRVQARSPASQIKGGLPAALFKPRTVKGTASQATPPGRCQAPASKPYCCVTAASALITGPSLHMRQAGRAVTFHFLQLQGSSRALYPFQELPILAARHQDHQPAVPRCRQRGRRSRRSGSMAAAAA